MTRRASGSRCLQRILRAAPLACVLGALTASPVEAGLEAVAPAKSWAFLLGIGEYATVDPGVTELAYPAKDVDELQKVFSAAGYEIRTLVDDEAKRENILTELFGLIAGAGSQDTVVIFLSGHTAVDMVTGKVYFLTYYSRLSSLYTEAIRIEHLFDYLGDIRAKRKLLLFETCPLGSSRTGEPVTRGARPATRLDFELRRSSPDLSVLAVSHCSIVASEQYGALTSALLKAASTKEADFNGDAQVSLGELIAYSKDQIARRRDEFLVDISWSDYLIGESFGWVVFDLPGEQPRDLLVERYLSQLVNWRAQNWISPRTFVEMRSALDAWQSDESALDDRATDILERGRQYLDLGGGTYPDRFLATSFEEELELLRQKKR